MKHTRVIVQECAPGTIELLCRLADETLVPRVRSMPGFISYQVAKVDDRWALVISTFETREGAEEMERLGVEWRKQYGGDMIVSVQPYIGAIILDATAALPEAHPTL